VDLADRILQELAGHRFYWMGRTFTVGASIGVLALGEGVDSVADALAAADHACYLAKDAGRNRVQRYRPDDREVQLRRGEMHWVERLQAALDGDGFVLAAQEIRPIARPARRAGAPLARHFELLLRLRGDGGELVAPMAFIPAAERYGLMPRIDRWVIARACREIAGLRREGERPPICMVNLSGASASDPTLAEYIARCLRENGLEGSCLGVELTETVAVGNLTTCSELMTRLRRLGCVIALDDFGTGMSSFSYLRNLPINLLKIDRAFVRDVASDPIDHALVETIQRIATIMGVHTVAEGIESEDVLAALALIGVDFAQGMHVRAPVPLAQMMVEEEGPGAAGVRPAAPRSAASS
jgi:EAL domain-containing protein (putative c-di-GMP-specific phosphodiesterase class I)